MMHILLFIVIDDFSIQAVLQQIELSPYKAKHVPELHAVFITGQLKACWHSEARKYYGRRFTSRADLASAIENYICYYHTCRV